MVKLGFIAEGATEKIVLEHSDFFGYLSSLKIDFISEVIDADGNGNLLPHNIIPFTKVLEDKGATHIFVLTDLDEDECITNTKNRIAPLENHIVIVSVKAIEAWFLADVSAMRNFLEDQTYTIEDPESIADPVAEIKARRMSISGRGVSSKPILAKRMMRSGFSINRAAEHPNCSSAKYFLKRISEITTV